MNSQYQTIRNWRIRVWDAINRSHAPDRNWLTEEKKRVLVQRFCLEPDEWDPTPAELARISQWFEMYWATDVKKVKAVIDGIGDLMPKSEVEGGEGEEQEQEEDEDE